MNFGLNLIINKTMKSSYRKVILQIHETIFL